MDCPHCGRAGLFTQHPVVDHFFKNGRNVTVDVYRAGHCYGDLFYAGMDFCYFVPTDFLCIWRCPSCGRFVIELHGQNVWPDAAPIPAHEDMPDVVRETYDEAQAIRSRSPRAGCALLRATVERLVKYLLPEGSGTLAKRISDLKPSSRCLQYMTVARLMGNEAVHGSDIDLSTSNEEALVYFDAISKSINLMVDELITAPKDAEKMMADLEAAKAKR